MLFFLVPFCIRLLINEDFWCTWIFYLNDLFSVKFVGGVNYNSAVLALVYFTVPRNVHVPYIIHLRTGYHVRLIWIGTFIRGTGHILINLRSLIGWAVFILGRTFWGLITALWSLKVLVDAVQFIGSVALRTASVFNYNDADGWSVAGCHRWLLFLLTFMGQLVLHLNGYIFDNYFYFLQ